MAELFTHVLAGFVLARVLSWRFEWITTAMVTVAMVGAAMPDLNRVELVVPADLVEAMLGTPFSWHPLHRVGGTAVLIVIGALLVPRRIRCGVVLMLMLGAGSHFVLDLVLYKPSGWSNAMLWPLWDGLVPVGGFYLSSDRWPAVVSAVVAGGVWVVDRRVSTKEDEHRRP